MFYHIPLEHEIKLHPKYFGPQLMDTVKQKLFTEVEGTCSGKYGFVIAVTTIDDIGSGLIEPGRGFVVYPVKYKAIVFRPFKGEVVDAIVVQVNKVGLFTQVGPLSCFISRHSIPPDMEFDANSNPPCYKTKDEDIMISPEDEIRVKIVGTRINATDIFVIGSLMDDYLGWFGGRKRVKMYRVVFVLVTVFCVVTGDLRENLRHFEVLHSSELSHERMKRDTDQRTPTHPAGVPLKELSFKAMGKEFNLMLSPRRGVLDKDFEAAVMKEDGEEEPVYVDEDTFFEGKVAGEKGSRVTAYLEDGLLTASIETPDETYHIEPSWRHLNDSGNESMIVYRGSDIKFSWENADEKGEPGRICGYVKEGEDHEDHDHSADDLAPEKEEAKMRTKRQEAEAYKFQLRKTRCPLLLVADYRFFKEMGGGSTKTTINYLISLIDRVHKIYTETEWRDGPTQQGFSGMGFVIKKIIVHPEVTRIAPSDSHYNMQRSSWDVRSLLEVFSRQYAHKNFCLAHLFTDIKFDGGILGLAYVGSPRRNSVGGICTPEYFKNGYTLYLNSGLSSSRNHYGQRVITREADLVTAHEFGHNWGSEHDPDLPECSPKASEGGSYLMYTYSVSGYDYNNKKFSPCSLRSIRAVLLAKSSRCFTEPEESFCGNLRVEKGEECDAGLVGTEDVDNCCDKTCKLRTDRGAKCSDKNSPCCRNCKFMSSGIKCRDAQRGTCEKEARCTGNGAECPPSPPLPDGTPCIEKGTCYQGKCLPFCESQKPSLQSCMCDVLENACKRCCRTHLNDTCFPVDPLDILPNGTPCMVGYCKDGMCEKTVQDIVERFWDIIEDISINSVLYFLRDNIVGTVLIVSIILWIPVSCLISFVDAKRLREYEKYVQWLEKDQLVHPADPHARRVIRVTKRAGTRSTPQVGSQPRRVGSGRRDNLSVISGQEATNEVSGFPGTAL
ncbi:unnamed protein product [Notodromas monacha]|uniref:DNA-directed RNA polymerase II subunit RPB7 n=1 Tax=Notodromas monacha TaxID=399045 RepID=A0A7R9BMR9_9CRUS|nr:unnamed protein product [Notodromas monacha]CAG0917009.1 unnamed protein product [Notodromas monacha]